jgi:vacuolar-type H+-ATPase subunit H
MEDERTAAIRKKAEAEALKMIELAEQKARQVIEEARKTANEETSRTFEELKQNVRHIIHDPIKIADADAESILAQAEEKAFQIVEESKEKTQTKTESDDKEGVERVADADQTQRLQQTLKPIMEKAAPIIDDQKEKQKANNKQRVELVIVPPIDMIQLEKLRLSLQQLGYLRILSMWGTTDGGTSIFALMQRPAPLISDLRKADVVYEAIEIEDQLLGSDLANYYIEKDLPLLSSKRSDEQRILVLLKRTG